MTCTTGEMAEPRDVTLTLHWECHPGGSPCSGIIFPAILLPATLPTPQGWQNQWRINGSQNLSNKTAFPESRMGMPGYITIEPQVLSNCVPGTNQDGSSTETCRTGECHWGMTTLLQRPPKGPRGCCSEEQAQKAGGGGHKWLRPCWPQSRALAVLSLTPLERPLYWTSGRGLRLRPWPDAEPPVHTRSPRQREEAGGRAGSESYISSTAVCRGEPRASLSISDFRRPCLPPGLGESKRGARRHLSAPGLHRGGGCGAGRAEQEE